MALAAFDTHRYVKRLTAAGMPEPQAEVSAFSGIRCSEVRGQGELICPALPSDIRYPVPDP